MRRSSRAGLVAATVLSALAVSAAASALGLTWQVERAPFRLVFLDSGQVLTEQAAPAAPGPGTRMSYELPGGDRHTLTSVVSARESAVLSSYVVGTTEPGRTARVVVRRTERGLRVELALVPDAGAVRVYEAFRGRDEFFLGSGQRAAVNLSGLIVQLKLSQPCRNNLVTPFYVSSAGYGVYVDSASTGALGFRTPIALFQNPCAHWGANPCAIVPALALNQICLNASGLAYEVYAGLPAQVVSAYARGVGLPPLPPPEQFALIKWRDAVQSLDEVREDVIRLQAAGIPLGTVLLDNPWEAGGCQGALAFGPPLGEPGGLLAFLAERRVQLMLWVSPLVRRSCGPQGYPAAALVPFDNRHWVVDFRHPEAAELFRSRLRALVRLGVAGVKADRGDEVDLEAVFADSAEHNRYPQRFAQAIVDVLREERGQRFTTMFRAGSAGSQALVHGVWSGDQRQTWSGLLDAVRMAQSASVSGFPIWGSDIGGYANAPGDPELGAELFLRWAQLGAISPIFEVGGDGPNAVFWTFGEQTVELFRRTAVLHYELFPYLYELARTASRTGVPVLRPLGYAYPRDNEAWYHDDQLLVGPSLLAQIVLGPSGSRGPGDTRPLRLWLPAGEWIDFFTGEPVAGRGTITRWTSIADFPLYLRRGAAIPLNFRTPRVFAADWDVNDLDRPGRHAWLYAPDLRRAALAHSGTATFRARRTGRTLTIRLAGARRETAVRLLTAERVCAVAVDGRPVPRVAGLPSVASGWTVDSPGRSLVVKRTGRAGAARIDVRFCA